MDNSSFNNKKAKKPLNAAERINIEFYYGFQVHQLYLLGQEFRHLLVSLLLRTRVFQTMSDPLQDSRY